MKLRPKHRVLLKQLAAGCDLVQIGDDKLAVLPRDALTITNEEYRDLVLAGLLSLWELTPKGREAIQ